MANDIDQTGTVLMQKKCMMCGQAMAHGYDYCGRCGRELVDPFAAHLQKRQALRVYFKEFIFDLLIPLLVGIKTTWLIFREPSSFFRTVFFQEQPANKIEFPLTNLWKRLSNAPQYVFQPGKYWFFVLAFMAVASILLRNEGLLDLGSGAGAEGEAEFANSNLFFITLRPMINRIIVNYGISDDLLELPFELLYILFVFFSTALLAFIYHRLMGKQNLPSNHNYTFWLYFVGALFIGIRLVILAFALFARPSIVNDISVIRSSIGYGILGIGLGYLFLIYPLYMPIYVLSKLFNTISFNRALKVTLGTYLIYGVVMGSIYLIFTGFSWLPRVFS